MKAMGSRPLKTGAIVAVGIAVLLGWLYHQSPGQEGARTLKAAGKAAAAGQVVQAAQLYGGLAEARNPRADDAAKGLATLLQTATLEPLSAADAARVLGEAQRARRAGHPPMAARRILELGWPLVGAHSAKDPVGAKALLDAISPLESDKARVDGTAGPLLDRIVAVQPGNAAAAMELAELLDRRNDCLRCEALLRPHAAALGRSESARILGQVYAGKGLLDESYALLQPYTEDRLKNFNVQEAAYRASAARIEEEGIKLLRSGNGPAEFYARYDKADETAKRELVSAFIDERLSKDTGLKAQIESVRRAAAIVPVALDLGIVTLQRAQRLSDPAARNAQLQAAEKVLLSIRGAAGDSDAYRLHLGQVYYWLGKQAEGKVLFDALLASHKRDASVLFGVASVLRNIGSDHESRPMAEESYRTASNDNVRWQAAMLRSMMPLSAQDEVTWLERSDRSSGQVRSSIHRARGRLAEEKGQRALARREFEQALAELEKMPESAFQLNSLALTQLALYALEGERSHGDAGLALLDKALSLQPTDSILLINSAHAAHAAAAAAFVSPAIDLSLLHRPADFQMTAFMHQDEVSREQVRSALRSNAAVKKSLAYSEKAALLAPQSPAAYQLPMAMAVLLDDHDALDKISAQGRAARVDLSDAARALQKTVDGEDAAKHLDTLALASQQAKAVMQQAAVQKNPATWAVAAGHWVDLQVSAMRWGKPIDPDALVAVARKAYLQRPTSGAHSMLMNALEARVALRLAKGNAAFANTLAQHARVVDPSTLFALHVDEDPAFRRLALADPDVKEMLVLLREREQRYPSRVSLWAWQMTRHTDAARGDALARRIASDRAHAAQFKLRDVFEPPNADVVLDRYHYALARGDRAAAQRVLDEAGKAGIRLPEVAGRQLKEPVPDKAA